MKQHLTTSLRSAHFGLLALSLSMAVGKAYAGDPKAAEPPVEPTPPPSIFSGDLGVTIANAYNTRGIIVQDSGVTFEPYLDLYAAIYQGDGFINKVSLQLNLWSDVSTRDNVAAPGNSDRHFTEFDYAEGLLIQFAKRFTLSTVYNRYLSPSDGYPDGSFINSTLSFDDSGLLWKNFSFHPHFTFLYETPDKGHAGLAPEAWYFEPGISPNYTFFADSKTPVNLALNAKFGLGQKFYGGDSYGYFAFGPQVSVPLSFLGPQYGKWTASAGYLYYNLGKNVAAASPSGDKNENLFTFSIGVQF